MIEQRSNRDQRRANHIKLEHNRIEIAGQNKANQRRAEQKRAEQSRIEQNTAEQRRIEQNEAGKSRIEQLKSNKAEKIGIEQRKAEKRAEQRDRGEKSRIYIKKENLFYQKGFLKTIDSHSYKKIEIYVFISCASILQIENVFNQFRFVQQNRLCYAHAVI